MRGLRGGPCLQKLYLVARKRCIASDWTCTPQEPLGQGLRKDLAKGSHHKCAAAPKAAALTVQIQRCGDH